MKITRGGRVGGGRSIVLDNSAGLFKPSIEITFYPNKKNNQTQSYMIDDRGALMADP
jgi:hypothetical protein